MRTSLRPLALTFCALFFALPARATVAETGTRTVSTADLASLRDLDPAALSPNGRLAVMAVRQARPATNDYVNDWMLVSVETGEARRLGDAGPPGFIGSGGLINGSFQGHRAVWSPDGQHVFHRRHQAGRFELWRTDVETGSSARVERFAGDVEGIEIETGGRTALVRIGPDPELQAAAREQEGRSGYLFDDRFFPMYSVAPVLPAGRSRLPTSALLLPATGETRYRIDLTTLSISPTQPPAASARPTDARGAVVEAPTGARAWLAARDPDRQGFRAPLTISADGGPGTEPIVCARSECTSAAIAATFWHGEEVLFAVREGPTLSDHVLYGWSPASNALRSIFRSLTGAMNWDCGQTSAELICRFEEPLRPARLIGLDLESGAVRTVFDPNPQFADLSTDFTVERVDATTQQGVPTYGYLVRRADLAGQPLPLAVVTYRCSGFLRGGTGDEYPVLPLASEGFATFCFHVPDLDADRAAVLDATAYTREQRAGNVEKVRVHMALEALVNHMVVTGAADGDRVAITGLSFGAETTGYALFNMPNLTAAIASSAAITPANIALTGGAWRSYENWGLADPENPVWAQISVSANSDRVRAPLLLNLADREMIGATDVYVALDRAGRAVEAFVYPDEYHIKGQPAHRLAVYNRNIDWLSFWLRGGEEGLTGDPGQYARWRTLRDNQCRLFGPNGSERHARPRGHESLSDNALTPWYCLD